MSSHRRPSLLCSARTRWSCIHACSSLYSLLAFLYLLPISDWYECRVLLFGVTVAFYVLLAVGVSRGLKAQLGVALIPWPSWAWWLAVISSWLWLSLGIVAVCGKCQVSPRLLELSSIQNLILACHARKPEGWSGISLSSAGDILHFYFGMLEDPGLSSLLIH